MTTSKNNIFISYSWNDSKKVDLIEEAFNKVGLNVTRDVNNLRYKDSLQDFMKSVRDHKYCLIMLTDSYLKSENCLFELLEFYKEPDFKDRILPIYHEVQIFNSKERIKYLEYWNDCLQKKRDDLKSLDPVKANSEFQKVKNIEFISINISDFLTEIEDQKILPFDECRETNFSDILEFLNFDKDSIKSKLLKIDQIKSINDKETELEKLLINYPNNYEIVLYKAQHIKKERNNPSQAILLYQSYLSKNPKSVIGLCGLSHALYDVNKFDEAIETHKKALSISPQNASVYKSMGYLAFRISNKDQSVINYESAIEYLEKASELNKDSHETYFYLGEVILIGTHDLKKALINYKKAINLREDYLAPYPNTIILLDEINEKNESNEYFEKAKKHFKNKPEIEYVEAMLLMKSKKGIVKGVNILKKLVAENLNDEAPYLQLAKYYFDQEHDLERAISILKKGEDLVTDPIFIEKFLEVLGLEMLSSKESLKIQIELKELLSKESYSKAHDYIQKNINDIVKSHYTSIYELYNNWGSQLKEIAEQGIELEVKKRFLDLAIEKFKIATKYIPAKYEAWANWSLSMALSSILDGEIDKNRLEEFEKVSKKAISIKENVYQVWTNWGILISLYGNNFLGESKALALYEKAIEKLKKADEIKPNDFIISFYLGKIYGTIGSMAKTFSKSKKYYEKAIEFLGVSVDMEPNIHENWMYLAKANYDLAELHTINNNVSVCKYYLEVIKSLERIYVLNLDSDLYFQIAECYFKLAIHCEVDSKTYEKQGINYLKKFDLEANNVKFEDHKSWDDICSTFDLEKLLG